MKDIYSCPHCRKKLFKVEGPLSPELFQLLNDHWTSCLEKQIADSTLRLD